MRIHKLIQTIPTKIYLLLLVALVLSFFSNDFGLVDIQKTAIILAAGIDKTDDGFLVTTQIAIPKGDRTTGGTSSIEINSTGATVSDCVTHIYSKTGWVPKFVFCDLIIIGEDLAKDNAMPVLNYFLRNDYIPDACAVAVATGTAQEVISSQSAIDDTSSQAILKLFTGITEKSGTTVKNTLKNFAITTFGVSRSGFMPYIQTITQKKNETSESAAESSEHATEKVIYSAERTAIFSEGKMVDVLTPSETFAYNLLHGKVFAGTITIENKTTSVSLSVIQNSGNVQLSAKTTPTLSLDTDITVQLFDRQELSSLDDIASDIPTQTDLNMATALITSYIRSLWDRCSQYGCDLFLLKRSLLRTSPKLFPTWSERLPQEITPNIHVTVQGVT